MPEDDGAVEGDEAAHAQIAAHINGLEDLFGAGAAESVLDEMLDPFGREHEAERLLFDHPENTPGGCDAEGERQDPGHDDLAGDAPADC